MKCMHWVSALRPMPQHNAHAVADGHPAVELQRAHAAAQRVLQLGDAARHAEGTDQGAPGGDLLQGLELPHHERQQVDPGRWAAKGVTPGDPVLCSQNDPTPSPVQSTKATWPPTLRSQVNFFTIEDF